MTAYKIIGYFVALLAVTHAGIIGPGAAAAVAVAQQPAATVIRAENYDSYPRYSFGYSVADGFTGDNKAQEETRNGDVVQGSYSLIEPDGSRRIVSYAADPANGFNAVVRRDPGSITVRTAAVATAPVRAAVVASPSVITAVAPAAIAVRPQTAIFSVPLLRQPFISGSAFVAANSRPIDVTAEPGSTALYGTRTAVADDRGNGDVVKIR